MINNVEMRNFLKDLETREYQELTEELLRRCVKLISASRAVTGIKEKNILSRIKC
jgi:hypothetical protein